MPEREIPLSAEEFARLKDAADKKRETVWRMAVWFLKHDTPEHEGKPRGEVARTIAVKVPGTIEKRVAGVARILEIAPKDAARLKIAAHLFGHD